MTFWGSIITEFIAGTTAVVHAIRAATGTSLAGARAAGWLMAEAAGAPATQLYASLSPSLVRWDLLLSSPCLSLLVSAALFGPGAPRRSNPAHRSNPLCQPRTP